MSANGIKIVFGGAAFMSGSVDDVTDWLKTLEEAGITTIDTAQIYGASEELLGKAGAASRFSIDTKHPSGFSPQPSTKDVVVNSCKESLQKLKTNAVDVYYLHAPDRRLPWKDTLSGLNELYKQGAFKRLGLSNFLGHEVEEIIRVAKENNFVLPSVYQGNYSAVARRVEEEILPILRKHNIAFYAYSPIAGGFLSKSKAALTDPEGRFGKDNPLAKVYNGMYNRPSFVAALDVWEQIAKDEGVSRAELAYRWVVYHSKLQGDLGDAVIIGARNQQQLKETLEALKNGPLSDGAVKRISEIWESVKAEAVLDNFELLSKR
ncbi:Aldo/keto reductase [Coniochaeta sp. PMI_546]|nr:Aldo/keto reductase [Coniochaeta sp. PMI_546]